MSPYMIRERSSMRFLRVLCEKETHLVGEIFVPSTCTAVGISTKIELGEWGEEARARKADMPELLPLVKCLVRAATRPILL
jgi:hypothetical protein